MTPETNHNRKQTNPNRGGSLAVKIVSVLIVLATALAIFLAVMPQSSTADTEIASQPSDDWLNQTDSVDDGVVEKVDDDGLIYENITIDGIAVGGMTTEEATALLKEKLTLADLSITITSDNGSEQLSFDDFGASYDIAAAVSEAYNYTRVGSEATINERKASLANTAYDIECAYSYDESKVSEYLTTLGDSYYIAARNPSFERINGEFVVGYESSGQQLNSAQMSSEIVALLDTKSGGNVDVVLEEIGPTATHEDYAKATSLLATYSTSYSTSNANRSSNVQLAASNINNVVVMPGDSFSTNENFKSRTTANGYAIAAEYSNGQVVEGVGGGICQVSSTLYMAILNAELEIVTRTNHSMKVGYMDYGYDAVISEGSIDFVWRNNTDYPVTVVTTTDSSKKLTVNIYGYESRPSNRTIKFGNALISSTAPAEEKVIEDSSLPAGQRVVETSAKTGYKYELYKYVYVDGALADTVRVNTSTYRAVQGVVRVGTGAAVAASETAIETETGEAATPSTTEATTPTEAATSTAPAETTNTTPSEAVNTPSEVVDTPSQAAEPASESIAPAPAESSELPTVEMPMMNDSTDNDD